MSQYVECQISKGDIEHHKIDDLRVQGTDIDGKWKQYTSPLTNSKYFYNAEIKLATTVDIRNLNFRHFLLVEYQRISKGNHQQETFIEQTDENLWRSLTLDHAEQSLAVVPSIDSDIGWYSGSVDFC